MVQPRREGELVVRRHGFLASDADDQILQEGLPDGGNRAVVYGAGELDTGDDRAESASGPIDPDSLGTCSSCSWPCTSC